MLLLFNLSLQHDAFSLFGQLFQYSCLGNPTEKLGRVYSPWDRKELDTTERLTLSHLFGEKSIQKYISTVADY